MLAPRAPRPAPMDIAEARVLVLSDGRTGSLNQSLGVAAMLGFADPETQVLKKAITAQWLRWLPVGMLYENIREVERAAHQADILIAAGHAPSRVLRYLKKQNPKLFIVAMMRPSKPFAAYDAIAIPRHDGAKTADNIILTLGNCNHITKALLAQEADRWRKRLSHLRGFKLALLVGGDSRHAPFGATHAQAMIETIAKQLKAQAHHDGALLVTTSRRTSPAATKAIEKALEDSAIPYHLWRPNGEDGRDNPYLAYLALADTVLITADSTSMVSEAATAGKPVVLWGDPTKAPKKFKALYQALIKQGRALWYAPDVALRLRPPASGLMDTLLVAGFIRARWQKRFGGKG